jgi:hypothetical protein
MTFKQITPVLILVGSLALVAAGCSEDDSDPGAPTYPTIEMDTEMAADWTGQALSMVTDMAVDVPTLVAGDFSGAKSFATDGGVPEWDVAQQAWVYTFNGPVMDMEPPSTWVARVDVWIQFRDEAGPVQYPLGAIEVEVHETMGMTIHMVDEGHVSDIDYDFETEMVVADIGTGDSYSVAGSGFSEVYISEYGGDTSRGGHFEMGWTMDLAVYQGGCPAGTASVDAPGWRMDATYDGAGSVDWVLTGAGGQASGTDTVDCTPGEV